MGRVEEGAWAPGSNGDSAPCSRALGAGRYTSPSLCLPVYKVRGNSEAQSDVCAHPTGCVLSWPLGSKDEGPIAQLSEKVKGIRAEALPSSHHAPSTPSTEGGSEPLEGRGTGRRCLCWGAQDRASLGGPLLPPRGLSVSTLSGGLAAHRGQLSGPALTPAHARSPCCPWRTL